MNSQLLSPALQRLIDNCCFSGECAVPVKSEYYIDSTVDRVRSEAFLRGDFIAPGISQCLPGFPVHKMSLHDILSADDQVFVRYAVQDRDLSFGKSILRTGRLITSQCYDSGRDRSVLNHKTVRSFPLTLYIHKFGIP